MPFWDIHYRISCHGHDSQNISSALVSARLKSISCKRFKEEAWINGWQKQDKTKHIQY
jgi:hypothetical protein